MRVGRTAGLVSLLLVSAVFVAGCRAGLPARLRSPTLTPILLRTATQPAQIAAVTAKPSRTATPADRYGTSTRTPAPATATASPSRATSTMTATSSPTSSRSPTATRTPGPAPKAAPAATSRKATAAPQQAGKIAFEVASGGDIYLLPASGGGARRVTRGLDPALSPDGSQLAFARWDNAPGIYVLDLKTGAERQVAGAQRPRSPSWSSDGKKLVFARTLGTTSCRQTPLGCFSDDEIRAQTGGQECMDTPYGRFCISDFPLVERLRSDLMQVDALGGEPANVPAASDAESPAWRPGSDDILFLGDGRLQIGGRDRTPRPLRSDPWTLSPAWSPDGARIAAQRRLHDAWEIALLDSEGATVKYLTSDSGDNVSPSWSPDGKSILFLSNRDGRWRLYRMNPDGSGQALFRADALKSIDLRYDYAAERVASWAP